jgi:hypothetical protein
LKITNKTDTNKIEVKLSITITVAEPKLQT